MSLIATSGGASRRFCALESKAAGDPLAGTASHPVPNLLVSWPRGRWSRSLRLAVDMPDELTAAIEGVVSEGRRVNLIHRRQQPAGVHRLFLMPERQMFDLDRCQLPAFLAALRNRESLTSWRPRPVHGSLLLCCTHGRKDKCCAKFGYGTYKALAAAAESRGLPFDVWESTHLGGCRLAASAMVFPALRKYGRIEAADVEPLLASEAGNRPYLPCYRGDSTLTPVQQCAEVAALEWLESREPGARIWLDEPIGEDPGNMAEVRVHWRKASNGGELRIRCQVRELLRHDTCADFDKGEATPSKVWTVTGIRPAEPA